MSQTIEARKRADLELRIKEQLKRKVRPHRPAAKVLEIAIALAEERIELQRTHLETAEWHLSYLKLLKPSEIEPKS